MKRVGYLGRKHEYVYYDEDFIDESTGVSYEKGYYDEEGHYYKQVAFKDKDGLFSADFVCNYCGKTAKMKWQNEIVPTCPGCGAALDVVNIPTDELRTAPYRLLAGADTNRPKKVKSILLVVLLSVFALCTTCCGVGVVLSETDSEEVGEEISSSFSNDGNVSNTDIYGSTLYLKQSGDNAFVSAGADDYSLKLKWDYGADSYYEPGTECYVWYNTDVAPNLWQYWYEGISSDYGEYGWMEYEDSTDNGVDDGIWYIETSEGQWEQLPDGYQTDRLWHILEEDS